MANLLKLLKKPRVMLSIFAAGKTQQIIQIIYSSNKTTPAYNISAQHKLTSFVNIQCN